eukprot:CAMPEP_0174259080 /NCGR_PEP_ID=MMETSP0439-20130205/7962_1 /TAXON_ID=0 /ORGANISM="Stereomyxa ramosa, Strain Chinc5" /LENGTH=834 /DNA_ID=CAMNT_0015342833 /DNA_START=45 /DNA_END=2549 /DNA_ORIENTATION=+
MFQANHSLIELIKLVRNCKTAADERAVIAKECAHIRKRIRDEDVEFRHRNVAKLLYIHMLGYPTHFGQMECLKLITSPSYSDKRIGYLALSLLLDERQEILMLGTQSIKNDLDHPNPFVVGLALGAVANIASAEIARDASSDVQKLLGSSNPYIRKKAGLCAVRIIRKVPHVIENFVPCIKSLLSERHHGVLLTGISLMIEICELEEENISVFRKMVPSLVRILKQLHMSGYAPDHDVHGITDPFLQTKIMQLLCILGKGDAQASDAMNDILAQVATNTESNRNVGNTILYQCVHTIMSIESEGGLRVLGINILGRFLLNRDNNIRYVALSTLAKVVSRDVKAVQRHTKTIVECLKDPDVSIRRRALELVNSLTNRETVKFLVNEMLVFLQNSEPELRGELTTKICTVTERYSPNKRWHLDTIIKVISMPGNHISEEVVNHLITLIAAADEDLHAYAVGKLYSCIQSNLRSQPLVQVAVWCIGEYGDILVSSSVKDEEGNLMEVKEVQVITQLRNILRDTNTTTLTKEFILTALLKLSNRFENSDVDDLLADMIQYYSSSLNVELQQRSCEYSNIFRLQDSSDIRSKLLDRMPAPEDITDVYEDDYDDEEEAQQEPQQLLSIENGILSTSNKKLENTPVPDLLSQIFGDEPLPPIQGGKKEETNSSDTAQSILSLFSGPLPVQSTPVLPTQPVLQPSNISTQTQSSPTKTAKSPTGSFPAMTAFQKNGLTVVFNFSKPTVDTTVITVVATNSLPANMTDFSFLAAVPKYLSLQMNSPSGTVVPSNSSGKLTQQLKIENSLQGQKSLLLKIKVEYTIGGNKVTEQATISNFPPGL